MLAGLLASLGANTTFTPPWIVAAVAVGCALALLTWRRAPDRTRGTRALLVLALAATGSFTGGIGDRFGGYWAAPEAPLQGHAVWHTLGAVALLAAYEVFAAAGFDRSVLRTPTAVGGQLA